MGDFRRVTVAGVTGTIGSALIKALDSAGFDVQGLTRRNTADKPDLEGPHLLQVDYTNEKELQRALAGQDAVISVLGDTAGCVAAQEALIHASVAVGVKRFIPSEFGSDTQNPRVQAMPFFADKLKHQALLREAAANALDFSYSIIITGPFLDWGLSTVPFILNIGSKTAHLFDGGNVPFSTTSLPTLCHAVINTFANPTATANRILYVHDAIVTQNQLLDHAEGLDSKLHYIREDIDMRTVEAAAWKAYHDPSCDPLAWVFSFINLSIWSREELCCFKKTDNELLGIREVYGMEASAMINQELVKAAEKFGLLDEGTDLDNLEESVVVTAIEEGKSKLVGFSTQDGYESE